jgi:NAD(P)-dependent dehydrogenase (short-subunit alcohol dehydrogenase family)
VRDNGSIVFISTVFTRGFIPQFPCSAVGAIKAAYGGFAKNACYELAQAGIRVNTLDLGVVETPIYGLDKVGLASLSKMQPLGINGQPEDVAEAVTFLTERSPFTTGQIIAIDGGVSAGHFSPA